MEIRKSQRGIGLLELMLSLAIIAILLVMATRYFGAARQGQQVAQAISMLQAISAAAQTYAVGNNNSMSAATATNLLTSTYFPGGSPPQKNPWGGGITITGAANTLTVTFAGVPTAACNMLVNQTSGLGNNSTSSCGSNSFAIVLGATT